MKPLDLIELGLGLGADWISPSSPAYRPSTWPPQRDWPVSIDREGTVLSRWGDSVWDLTPFAGTIFKLNFGDGPVCQADSLDSTNADILRLAITWRIWGHRSVKAYGTLQASFTQLRAVMALCSKNGIAATDLMRFPKVFEQLPKVIAPSRFESTITELHRLYDSRHILGFVILDLAGLQRLAGANPGHDTVQTPYIPPRIWVYQVKRLRECLDDFLAHRMQVEACFNACLNAYVHNYGSIEAALAPGKSRDKQPFNQNSGVRTNCVYLGPFLETANKFELTPLFVKWLGTDPNQGVSLVAFSAYLTVVTFAAMAYIANFTLQRKEEIASLRASCLIWENDEKLGRVAIICGETTKTASDSDARWVASPSVEYAVTAMTVIARLRMACDSVNPAISPTQADIEDPYLVSTPTEPWGTGSGKAVPYYIRSEVVSIIEHTERLPLFFDAGQMRITEDDLKIARQLTPNLPEDKFRVGAVWPLAWHQYRRTGAVNMFSSGLISDSSMQHQMKHCSRLMPLYYGRGYTRLHLNEKVEATVISAMYSAMARQLQTAVGERFKSPYSDQHKQSLEVNIINSKDANALARWAKQGKVSYREHRLGGCMKAGACEYGGIESIARCAGGDTGKPCSDVLFDESKASQVQDGLLRLVAEMSRLPEDSPRYRALLTERRAMENYLNVIG